MIPGTRVAVLHEKWFGGMTGIVTHAHADGDSTVLMHVGYDIHELKLGQDQLKEI